MTNEIQPSLATSKAILAVNADSPMGSPLCLEFASKGARILIHHEDDMPTACRISTQVVAQGAIALPLQRNLPAGERALQSLVERMVDDFGRLDVVLYFVNDATSGQFAHMASACAKIALPYLRQSRPVGHFILIASASLSESQESAHCREIEAQLQDFAASMAAEYSMSKTRACVNSLFVPNPGPLPNEAARFAVHLSNLRGISGRLFCLSSLINILPY